MTAKTEPDGPWLRTATGGVMGTLNPRPEDVDLIDLAIGLSWTNRFLGAAGHYSVATHSVILSRWVERALFNPALCMAALLHDAHEVYLGDLGRPVQLALQIAVEEERPDLDASHVAMTKLGLFKRAWNKLKLRHDAAILSGLGLDRVLQVDHLRHPLIKEADARILADERDALWNEGLPFPYCCAEEVEPLGVEIERQHPEQAMADWLARYHELRARLGL